MALPPETLFALDSFQTIRERFNDDLRFLATHELLKLAQIDDEIEKIDECIKCINVSLTEKDLEGVKRQLVEFNEVVQAIVARDTEPPA